MIEMQAGLIGKYSVRWTYLDRPWYYSSVVPALRQCLLGQETAPQDPMRERNFAGRNPKRNGFDIEATSNPIPVPTCLHARFLPGWQSILVIQDLRPLVSSHLHLDKEVKATSYSCLGLTGIFVATLVKYQRSKGRCWLLGKNPCCWTSVGKDWDVSKALHYFIS